MEILEVPFPTLYKGHVLVRNHYSVISAGTEGKTVTDARKGYIAKAKSRQKEVKQVIDMMKLNGPLATYKLVMNKLEAPSPLGYSAAGEVIAVSHDVTGFKVGDKVACGGNTAVHADVIAVPENLCVKVPENVDLKHAAFSTIASIAIQGIRQAELSMGENCLIIGMGLVGQMTAQILKAAGIRPIGIDVSEHQVRQSKEIGINAVYTRDTDGLDEIIKGFSRGHGVDAVIITAGTSSLDPIEFAGSAARKKGKVVIVGAVPTGFSRANYYKKELDLRMSMSYGPGRGDANYEQKGIDYPIGYVRWTENRNMQSFLDLLEVGNLNIDNLISHTFELNEAPKAYDMILSKAEPFNGVVIAYDTSKTMSSDIEIRTSDSAAGGVTIGLIGAGNFAQGTLLPKMKGLGDFIGITSGHGNTARYVADKYGFNYCSQTAERILEDAAINTVVITTRHDSHAEYVISGIKANKHVFVEKPLSLNLDELQEVREAYESAGNQHKVMVGFNRRFAPAVQKLRANLSDDEPKSINIRVNAGITAPEHWTNDKEVGGGRIIGEACHFLDLARYIAGADISTVYATSMKDDHGMNNTTIVNLEFQNGSIASINYFSNGNKKVPKEYIEVFSQGSIIQIDDFKRMTISGKKSRKIKFKSQDKGHAREMELFLESVRNGTPSPISFEQCYNSSLATLLAIQSIQENRKIVIEG